MSEFTEKDFKLIFSVIVAIWIFVLIFLPIYFLICGGSVFEGDLGVILMIAINVISVCWFVIITIMVIKQYKSWKNANRN